MEVINNRYELQSIEGKGGQAVVYKAHDKLTNTTVAAKRVDLLQGRSDDLEKEVQILRSLKHKNIVRFLDEHRTKTHVYIILEYAQQGSLLSILKKQAVAKALETHQKQANGSNSPASGESAAPKPKAQSPMSEDFIATAGGGDASGTKRFPDRTAAGYTAQVLAGLKYLHGKGVLHRDIKAANVLLTDDDTVKLTDFGLAALVDPQRLIASGDLSEKADTAAANSTTTQDGNANNGNGSNDGSKANSQQKETMNGVVGSVYWMAPEIIKGEDVSEAADVWALGCLVVELLTGAPPFYDRTPVNALYCIAECTGVPLPPSLTPAAADFVTRCLRPSPHERLTTAALLEHPWITTIGIDDVKAPPTLSSSAAGGQKKSPAGNVTSGTAGGGVEEEPPIARGMGTAPPSPKSSLGEGMPLPPPLGGPIAHTSYNNNNASSFGEDVDTITQSSIATSTGLGATGRGGVGGGMGQLPPAEVVVPVPILPQQQQTQPLPPREFDPQNVSAFLDARLFTDEAERIAWLRANAEGKSDELQKCVSALAYIRPDESYRIVRSLYFAADQRLPNDWLYDALGNTDFWDCDLHMLASADAVASLFVYCCCYQDPRRVQQYGPSCKKALYLALQSEHAAACIDALVCIVTGGGNNNRKGGANNGGGGNGRGRRGMGGRSPRQGGNADGASPLHARESSGGIGTSPNQSPFSTIIGGGSGGAAALQQNANAHRQASSFGSSASPHGGGAGGQPSPFLGASTGAGSSILTRALGGGGGGGYSSASPITAKSLSRQQTPQQQAALAAGLGGPRGGGGGGIDNDDGPNNANNGGGGALGIGTMKGSLAATLVPTARAAFQAMSRDVVAAVQARMRADGAAEAIRAIVEDICGAACVGRSDPPLGWDCVEQLLSIVHALTAITPVARMVVTDRWIVALQEGANHRCPSAIHMFVRITREATALVARQMTVGTFLNIIVENNLPHDLKRAAMECLPILQGHDEVCAQMLEDRSASVPLLAMAATMAPPTTVHVVLHYDFATPILVKLCERPTMAAACASYPRFLPIVVSKMYRALGRKSTPEMRDAIRLAQLLFANSENPTPFVTSQQLTGTLAITIQQYGHVFPRDVMRSVADLFNALGEQSCIG